MTSGKNIFLAGFMGTGKTSAGKELARRLQAPFVDLDSVIEKREVMAVTDIFSRRGENYFRDVEHLVLKEVSDAGGQVVALGGGAVCFERNRRLLDESGEVVLLTADAEVIWKRVGASETRPLIEENDGYGRMMRLLAAREEEYRRFPAVVDTSDQSPAETAAAILELLEAGEGLE